MIGSFPDDSTSDEILAYFIEHRFTVLVTPEHGDSVIALLDRKLGSRGERSLVRDLGIIGLDLLRVNLFHEGMTRSADELVSEFCKLWASPNPDELAAYFTEDAVYHNIPMEPVQGRQAIKEFIAGFLAAFDGIDFNVHRQVSDGTLVMNERTDVMRRKGGGAVPLPVMGVFEVQNDRIVAWRDYFDMAAITNALS